MEKYGPLTPMAGLGLFDQQSALAVTMPIVTAFKFCIGHRKNGLLNRFNASTGRYHVVYEEDSDEEDLDGAVLSDLLLPPP